MSWALRMIFLTYPWVFKRGNLARETSVTPLNTVSRGKRAIYQGNSALCNRTYSTSVITSLRNFIHVPKDPSLPSSRKERGWRNFSDSPTLLSEDLLERTEIQLAALSSIHITGSISFQWPKHRKAKAFATLKILRTCRVTAGWPAYINLSFITYLSHINEVKTYLFWEWKNFSFRAILIEISEISCFCRVFTNLRFTSRPLPGILPIPCKVHEKTRRWVNPCTWL